jgi:hypothetical protein
LYFMMTLVFLVIWQMISVIYLQKILHHTIRDGSQVCTLQWPWYI